MSLDNLEEAAFISKTYTSLKEAQSHAKELANFIINSCAILSASAIYAKESTPEQRQYVNEIFSANDNYVKSIPTLEIKAEETEIIEIVPETETEEEAAEILTEQLTQENSEPLPDIAAIEAALSESALHKQRDTN